MTRMLRRSVIFFYLGLRRPENLDLHRLAPQGSLELTDALLGFPKLRSGDDFLAGADGGLCASLEEMLPSGQQGA